ncbi:MAG: methyltransferase domain-containing protein [Nitrospirota bacterium]|nr:methyltransferase domain-containing protein [Nitrospirota bacterium]
MAKNAQYIFNQTQENRERDRLKLIEQYHDPRTRKRLLATGIKAGWKCLEVGPGAGSIMRWVAKAVGTKGKVVALDINPHFVTRTRSTNIQIVKGDIASTTFPAHSFHLIHARFVLIHTPAYRRALANMIPALRPGGWLVLEEPDFSAARVVGGTKRAKQSVERVNRAIMKMFEDAGLNPAFGLEIPTHLQQLGMSHLTVENEVPITQGGSPLATIMKLSAAQLRETYLATGVVTESDITRYDRFAEDPKTWAIYHGTVAVRAKKMFSQKRTK